MPDANHSISQPPATAQRLRFGAFEVDFRERELRKAGLRVNLQRKPFQILELLLRRPGALVTREELARYLWPDLHVSFSHGLNTAVNTLRHALDDSPTTPRYIETRSGLGYRFIAPVEEVAEAEPLVRSVRRRYDADPGPYQDYLKARYLQTKLTRAELGKSIAHFEAAIVQDRRYAPAYAGLAHTYLMFALLGFLPPREARRKAAENARLALEIDPALAEAHTAQAKIRQLFERNHEAAEAACLRALELQPDDVDGYLHYAALLAATSRTAEAIHKIRRAQSLQPLSLAVLTEAAWVHYMAQNFEEAVNLSWQTLVLEPQFAPAQHTLGLAYLQLGMMEEAVTELNNARQCSENNVAILAGYGHALARAGNSGAAEEILQRLGELGREQYVSPFCRSVLYLGLGSENLASAALDQACEDGDPWLIWVKTEPRLAPLRDGSFFKRLAQRLERPLQLS
jgi:serine/threonine-protein kinase